MTASFDQLADGAREDARPLDPAAAHGFLSAAALCPGGWEHRPWAPALFGDAAVVDDELARRVRESVGEIHAALLAGSFTPAAADDSECMRWSEGFRRMLALAGPEWTTFNDTYPEEATRGLVLVVMFGDSELYTEVNPSQRTHAEFVRDNCHLLGPLVRKVAAYLLGGEDEALDEIDEDDMLESWCEVELRSLGDDELMEIVRGYDDRVPRIAIDECVRRGAAFVPRLRAHLQATDLYAPDCPADDWWAVLHAVFILGAMPGREAAEALLEVLQKRCEQPDDDLWDWTAGSWPALFQNKREPAAAGLAALAADCGADPYVRSDALECLIEAAYQTGGSALEDALDQAADIVADTGEAQTLRELTGLLLLDLPRERLRPTLEAFAREQERTMQWGRAFDRRDVQQAFAQDGDSPPWERYEDFLGFYAPAAIRARQRRWREEDEALLGAGGALPPFDDVAVTETYTRPNPKTGRNEPCPCGSGRKYKKCCMGRH